MSSGLDSSAAYDSLLDDDVMDVDQDTKKNAAKILEGKNHPELLQATLKALRTEREKTHPPTNYESVFLNLYEEFLFFLSEKKIASDDHILERASLIYLYASPLWIGKFVLFFLDGKQKLDACMLQKDLMPSMGEKSLELHKEQFKNVALEFYKILDPGFTPDDVDKKTLAGIVAHLREVTKKSMVISSMVMNFFDRITRLRPIAALLVEQEESKLEEGEAFPVSWEFVPLGM